MAHFAKLGTGNIVTAVHVVSNDVATTEQAGVDFLNDLYKTRDVWKQTSYNKNIRKNYAGIGYHYLEDEDVFLPPRRYDYYVPDLENYVWVPPIDKPDDQNYYWDDDLYQEDNTTGWVLIPEPEE